MLKVQTIIIQVQWDFVRILSHFISNFIKFLKLGDAPSKIPVKHLFLKINFFLSFKGDWPILTCYYDDSLNLLIMPKCPIQNYAKKTIFMQMIHEVVSLKLQTHFTAHNLVLIISFLIIELIAHNFTHAVVIKARE